jgi:hypothetical protein
MSIGENMILCPTLAGQGCSRRAALAAPLPLLLLFASSCQQGLASAEQPPSVSGEPTAATVSEQLQPTPDLEEPPDPEGDDRELRRGYGMLDMRSNGCLTRLNDNAFQGEACPTGFVIYGPYVPVPANSEIEVSFEVNSSTTLEVYADVVSQMGVQLLAGLSRQTVEAGVSQKLGYRVHVFNADTNVESRIGISAQNGTRFEISNLAMTVR